MKSGINKKEITDIIRETVRSVDGSREGISEGAFKTIQSDFNQIKVSNVED